MGSVGANNVIAFPTPQQEEQTPQNMVDNERGWKYPEISENIDKMESALANAKSANKISAVALALRQQDRRITMEIERLHNGTADVPGSEKALLTYRRRIRQLQKKARF